MSKTPIVALGDIAHFIRGINFKPDDVVPLGTEGSVACMRTKNVQSELDLTDVWAVDESFVRRDEQLLQAGDILVSSANSWNLVGKCSWIPELPWRASFGGFVSVLRANPAHVDARFLYQWFSWEHTQALLRSFGQKTTNISNLNIERALALKLPCHPLEEQRRIAAILDQAETLRTQRRTALALLDSLTQSLFLDLLEYAGSDVEKVAVEDAMDAIIDYRGKTPEKTTQGVPLVTAKVVKNGELLEPDEFIAEDAYDDWMQRGFPEAGDVLFTTEAPLGEVAQLDGRKVALAQRLLVLRGKHGLLQNTFLRFALTSWEVRRQIQTRATGSTVKGIRQKELRQVELPIPPFALQQTFATRIASIEALKATHRRALAALDALFASLQQRAFAGQL